MSQPETPEYRPGTVARIAAWASERRRAVLIGWVVALVGVFAVSGALGTNYANDFSLKGTESQKARDLLKRDFPAQAGDVDQIVLHTRSGKITDPAVKARVAPMLAKVERLPHVTGVVSPYASGGKQISKDGTIAFATVTFDEHASAIPVPAIKRVMTAARSAGSEQVQVELGGQAIEQANQTPLGFSTAVGLIAAMIVLLLTFGSALAMGLPIVTALLGLGTAIGLAGIASQVISMPDVSTELAAMIGLGVGIDYALFIVTRFRESYAHGSTVQAAIVDSMDTAGRAVLFAGVTVIIALLGQFALGITFLNGMAVASALAVLMTMLAALDRAARAALEVRRAPGPQGAPPRERRARAAQRHVGALVGVRRPPPLGGDARRPRDHARPGGSCAGAAPGHVRRRQRPGRQDHAQGLRPARPGLRPRLQRTAARRGEPAAGRRPHGRAAARDDAAGHEGRGLGVGSARERRPPDRGPHRLPRLLPAVAGEHRPRHTGCATARCPRSRAARTRSCS